MPLSSERLVPSFNLLRRPLQVFPHTCEIVTGAKLLRLVLFIGLCGCIGNRSPARSVLGALHLSRLPGVMGR